MHSLHCCLQGGRSTAVPPTLCQRMAVRRPTCTHHTRRGALCANPPSVNSASWHCAEAVWRAPRPCSSPCTASRPWVQLPLRRPPDRYGGCGDAPAPGPGGLRAGSPTRLGWRRVSARGRVQRAQRLQRLPGGSPVVPGGSIARPMGGRAAPGPAPAFERIVAGRRRPGAPSPMPQAAGCSPNSAADRGAGPGSWPATHAPLEGRLPSLPPPSRARSRV